jgi:multiple antibiotic resistance protein
VFIGLTHGVDSARRRQFAIRGVLVGGSILLLFALLGERLLGVLGIGMPAFRIAGGLLLLAIGFEMVFERRSERRAGSAESLRDEQYFQDISVFPLAIPLLAGPAAITTAVLQTGAHAGDLAGQAVVLAAMLIVLAMVAASLLASTLVASMIGPKLVAVMSRLLGLVLSALAVQQVIDGLKAAFGL